MKEKIFIFSVFLFALILRLINFSNNLEVLTAFLSSLMIVGIYFIIKKYDLAWARISVVFLVISPWLIVFSRNPYELFGQMKIVASPKEILQNYFTLFSAKYLFFSGIWPNSTKFLSYQGMMYLPDLFFLIFGLKQLLSKEKNIIERIVIYSFFTFLVISSIMPGSLLFTLLTGIVLVLVTAKGFASFMEKSKIFLFFIVFYLFFFIRFLDLYFFHI